MKNMHVKSSEAKDVVSLLEKFGYELAADQDGGVLSHDSRCVLKQSQERLPRRCGNPACQKQETFLKPKFSFRVCSLCRILPFCSQDCQRQHWKKVTGHPRRTSRFSHLSRLRLSEDLVSRACRAGIHKNAPRVGHTHIR